MARIKVQEGERLDDDHIERVIEHLEKGGSKKEAYDILNIKANPSRLTRIIESYHEKQATAKRLREANRGKPATNTEIQSIIEGSLAGTSLKEIAEDLYRPVSFVKNIIERVGIPQKIPGDYWERRYKSSIPDQCVKENFDKYEIVWSNHYNALSIVLEPGEKTTHIYVIEKIEEEPKFALNGKVYTGYGGRHAWQRNEELGTLEHLSKYGLDIYKPYRPHFPNWLN